METRKKVVCCLVMILMLGTMVLTADEKDTFTQVSTLDALMGGIYDGQMTLEELLKLSDDVYNLTRRMNIRLGATRKRTTASAERGVSASGSSTRTASKRPSPSGPANR